MSVRVTDTEALRHEVQRFVRGFGLLAEDHTPCGKPMSPREAHALMLLLERERAGTPPRQNDLAQELGIDKSNVTRLVQRLRSDERVEQVLTHADGRARLLHLTAKGRRLAESVEESSRQRFATLLARIPTPHRRDVLVALTRLNEALVRHSEETSHATL